MTELTIRLNDTFTTTKLEDFEYERFKNSKIDDIGITIFPVNAKTNMAVGFELSFNYKSLVKKISSFEGNICEKTKKYTLKIDGTMKIKLRPGVLYVLNEEEGGYNFKLVCISGDNVRVAIDGHEKYNENEAVLTESYTVTDFNFS